MRINLLEATPKSPDDETYITNEEHQNNKKNKDAKTSTNKNKNKKKTREPRINQK